MSNFIYYLTTFLESGLSVFGIRAPYEQPRYQVIGQIGPLVEIRAYPARAAVETAIDPADEGKAFGKLFSYITGANQAGQKIPMTIPVEQATPIAATPGQNMPMTIPVEMTGAHSMRFFLPAHIVQAGPPMPTDSTVHLITLPESDMAVTRFSGTLTAASRVMHTQMLLQAVSGSQWHSQGAPSVLSYDPPFAIPVLRRNEIAVAVTRRPG